jgi:hypothetical protein
VSECMHVEQAPKGLGLGPEALKPPPSHLHPKKKKQEDRFGGVWGACPGNCAFKGVCVCEKSVRSDRLPTQKNKRQP